MTVTRMLARALTRATSRVAGARGGAAGRGEAADPEAGMTTAEYAVGTVAACGFGGVLYKILTSAEVMGMLKDLIAKAFGLAF